MTQSVQPSIAISRLPPPTSYFSLANLRDLLESSYIAIEKRSRKVGKTKWRPRRDFLQNLKIRVLQSKNSQRQFLYQPNRRNNRCKKALIIQHKKIEAQSLPRQFLKRPLEGAPASTRKGGDSRARAARSCDADCYDRRRNLSLCVVVSWS